MSVLPSRYFHIPASWVGTALGFSVEIRLHYSAKDIVWGIMDPGLEEAMKKLRLLNITLRANFMPNGREHCSKTCLLPYIFMSGHIFHVSLVARVSTCP